MPTSNYQIGVESSEVELAYAIETGDWGVAPAVAFKRLRYISETLRGQKQRSRPGEVRSDFQVAKAITQQESASGDVTFPLIAGNGNDLMAAVLLSEFSAAVAHANIITTAAVADGFEDLTVDLTGIGVAVGQMIKVEGFSTSAINDYYRVTGVTDDKITTAPAPPQTEAAGQKVTIKGQMVRNGTTFCSAHLEKKLASNRFLVYPGSGPISLRTTTRLNQFQQAVVSFSSKEELTATATASTGAYAAAPTGDIFDPIQGFKALRWNDVPIAGGILGVELNASRSAGAQYAMGSSAAVGMRRGELTVSGSFEMYFSDFTFYERFKSEETGRFSYVIVDSQGNGYGVTLINATVMNPQANVGGPSQDVTATFELEGNPEAASPQVYGGKTLQLDYFPA